MLNSSTASGDAWAAFASRKSRVPSPMTSRPGRNFSTSGFGVASVWMNMGKMWRADRADASSGFASRLRRRLAKQAVAGKDGGVPDIHVLGRLGSRKVIRPTGDRSAHPDGRALRIGQPHRGEPGAGG